MGGKAISGLVEIRLPQKEQHRPQAVLRLMTNATLPDALRLSGLHGFCNILNLQYFVGRIRRLRRIRQVRHYCSRLETMLDMLLDCFSMVMPVCISTCCLVILDASVA